MGKDVGIGDIINARNSDNPVDFSQFIEHGNIGRRHAYNLFGSGRDDGTVESGRRLLAVACNKIRHCYVVGALPRVGNLYKRTGSVLSTQDFKSRSVFRGIYILVECFQRCLITGDTACQKEQAK